VTLVLALAAYVVVERVKFPVAGGWSYPTMLVFVPMLFVLPTPVVPLVALAAILLGGVPGFVSGRTPLTRLPANAADAWYSFGPALVLVLAGSGHFSWTDWPVYAAALLAQFVFDMAATVARCRIGEGIDPRVQVPLLLWVYSVDALLAPLGLAIAASAVGHPELMLLSLPAVGLLGLFARERQQRLDQTVILSSAYRGTALLLGEVIEADDRYTGLHSREVVDLALALSDAVGLSAQQRRDVEFTALLHDVGKIRVSNEILNKPGPLDADQWGVIRRHTIEGERMLKQVGGSLANIGTLVRASHERYDGTGYPDRLAGERIPIESRIVSVCDAFNAMTTDRPYRSAMPAAAALEELRRTAGTQFDAQLVNAFERLLAKAEDVEIQRSFRRSPEERPAALAAWVSASTRRLVSAFHIAH
jgi:HD-GYP domain-containing protein (c-di-GMP phosphodiesterase class II)